MNKLTEIKQRLNDVNNTRGREYNEAVEEFNTYAQSDVDYLLSLLEEKNKEIEEKDKALAFYADIDNYDFNGRYSIPMFDDNGNIARKALNTSSNNEGETQP